MATDEATFKDAMAQFATGVTVVTTRWQGHPVGITVNAFASVSLSPPLVLICVANSLYSCEQIADSGIFAVSLLTRGQEVWGDRFAGRHPEVADRFEGVPIEAALTGAPILTGCLAWVDCRVRHAYPGGDHTIFVGEVLACDVAKGDPLLYFDRRWSQLAAEGAIAGSSWPRAER